MYKELFKTASQTNLYIKIEAPAKPKSIKIAEVKLKCSFPEDLKAYLTEIDGDGDLFLSVERIVTENLSIRAALAECYPDLDQYLFFAGNGCGDYYGYRLSNGHAPNNEIILWEHEDNSDRTVASNLRCLRLLGTRSALTRGSSISSGRTRCLTMISLHSRSPKPRQAGAP
jgi:hypothetical protein